MTADTVSSTYRPRAGQIEWAGGLQFDAGRPDGPKARIDGDARTGPSPFDMLLAAVAACAATDVVQIMEKQRTPFSRSVSGSRPSESAAFRGGSPSAVLHFTLRGAGITPEKAERAVELSVTKYCSVGSSLRPMRR